eukprot:2022467-Amphidinium_carterae.1
MGSRRGAQCQAGQEVKAVMRLVNVLAFNVFSTSVASCHSSCMVGSLNWTLMFNFVRLVDSRG